MPGPLTPFADMAEPEIEAALTRAANAAAAELPEGVPFALSVFDEPGVTRVATNITDVWGLIEALRRHADDLETRALRGAWPGEVAR